MWGLKPVSKVWGAGRSRLEGWVLVGGQWWLDWEEGRLVLTKLGAREANWGQGETLLGFLGQNSTLLGSVQPWRS